MMLAWLKLYFISQFIKDLKPELRYQVQGQVPDTMERAVMLAKIQEQIQERNKGRFQKPVASLKVGSSINSRTEPQAVQGGVALSKERQLRDYCRANNLCFFCKEPYDPNHASKCTKRPQGPAAQLNTLAINDLDVKLTDDILYQLDMEDSLAKEFCTLSLNAIAGTEEGEALRLRSLVKNKVMLMLVDSGSSRTFVSSAFLQKVGISPLPAPAKSVKLANGDVLLSDQYVPKMEWWVQGYSFFTDMRVLELGAYDCILGFDWLKQFSPITHHWENRTMEFMDRGLSIKLQGIKPASLELKELPATQLAKWYAGNDIWALAIVDTNPSTATDSCPPQVQEVLDAYHGVFDDPQTLPPPRVYDHTIPILPGAVPVNSRPYRYSPLHKDEIEKQVKALLAAGLIIPSTSPYASHVLLVQKKDGSWRFCVDYTKLNDITIKNRFPMPLMDEIVDELAGAKLFTKLDMRAGYHKVRMQPNDEHKTTFKTHHGHYQFRVMPFGLTNAPAIFQCLMNDVLDPFLRKFVLVFLDDILIYSPTLELHVVHLRQVLSKLRDHKLYMKRSKCSFAQTTLEYLAHVIYDKGISTDTSKTAATVAWPIPSNVTELRGFLGLTGYYRKFVKHYGLIAKPLTQLLKKKQFQWSQEAQLAFEKLKQAMTTTPVMALPDFVVPFVVETDASDIGIVPVLMQKEQPVAYMSKALGPAHKNLSIYEKEFLALIMAVEKWRPYLQRQEFLIRTDHKSLSYLCEQNLHSDMQRKAMTRLMGLQFKVVYKKGRHNCAADALSRTGHVFSLQAMSEAMPLWIQEVLNSYTTDPKAQVLLAQLAIKSPDGHGFELHQGLIWCKGKIWIANNSALQTRLLAAFHASPIGGHSGTKATYHKLKHLFCWKGLKADVENYVKQCQICQQAKHEHIHPAGLLQPLPVPQGAWQDISMDFIEGLPVSEGCNVILVVVDRFTKYGHFIPLKHPFTAPVVAKLVMDHVVKLHGIPMTIVSDRDKIFSSSFWKSLFALLDTKLLMSSAYHPRTNGQTE
ncbi:uncharacterized protein C2845_PM13G02930 [Panicum miliaceum]|uniref:Reverse transcriptase n=1 Tax=Panicum miliaceum TaxID=4540 RepID=A0A3L6RFQ4_PANMI|nr:uncharacterized protein C2845_PM13G02930 [Panicum miliaceum]